MEWVAGAGREQARQRRRPRLAPPPAAPQGRQPRAAPDGLSRTRQANHELPSGWDGTGALLEYCSVQLLFLLVKLLYKLIYKDVEPYDHRDCDHRAQHLWAVLAVGSSLAPRDSEFLLPLQSPLVQ